MVDHHHDGPFASPAARFQRSMEVLEELWRCGLCLIKCARLRVNDIDLEQNQVIVSEERGMEDRSTMLPVQLSPLYWNIWTGVKSSV